MSKTADRFKREIAEHAVEIAHDDGLYRHVKCRHTGKSYSGYYWFDLITVPGALIFQGDGDSFVFQRTEDMFDFFRSSAASAGKPNYQYWAQKLTSGGVMRYSQDKLEQLVRESIKDHAKRFPNLAAAVQARVLDEMFGDALIDRKAVEDFQYWTDEDDPLSQHFRRSPDFEFTDAWEWATTDYDWWFKWACHGIVWAISQYDAQRTASELDPPTGGETE